jgi:hypothetical protein
VPEGLLGWPIAPCWAVLLWVCWQYGAALLRLSPKGPDDAPRRGCEVSWGAGYSPLPGEWGIASFGGAPGTTHPGFRT